MSFHRSKILKKKLLKRNIKAKIYHTEQIEVNKQNVDCLPSLSSSSYVHFDSFHPTSLHPSTIYLPIPIPMLHLISFKEINEGKIVMNYIICQSNFHISSSHSRHNICDFMGHGFAYSSQTTHKPLVECLGK